MRCLIDVINSDSKFLSEVIKPFYELLGLNFFNHLRVYKDSRVVGVISDPQWVEHYFSNGLHRNDFSSMPFHMMQSGNFVLDLNTAPKSMESIYRAAYEFDICQAFSIVDKQEDFCDHYLFAGPNNRTDLSEYFRTHIDLFEQFIFYYKEQVFLDKDLCSYLTRQLEVGAKNDVEVKEPQNPTISLLDQKLQQAIQVKKLCIKGYDGETWLTTRELDCLAAFLQGHSTKVAAEVLDISPRTVETHVRNIQSKTGANNILQLYRLIAKDSLLFKYITDHYQKNILTRQTNNLVDVG